MANDLGYQAVLSDILFCLTYQASGRLQDFDSEAGDVCEAPKNLRILALGHGRSSLAPAVRLG
jgi:hypothetical protein